MCMCGAYLLAFRAHQANELYSSQRLDASELMNVVFWTWSVCGWARWGYGWVVAGIHGRAKLR